MRSLSMDIEHNYSDLDLVIMKIDGLDRGQGLCNGEVILFPSAGTPPS